jgi:hypothetical protein
LTILRARGSSGQLDCRKMRPASAASGISVHVFGSVL